MKVRKLALVSALVACCVMTSAGAIAADAAAKPVEHRHFGADAALLEGPFLHAIHQLNLTADQQTTINGFMDAARKRIKSDTVSQSNVDALSNPGDPNYKAAVSAAKTLAANRIQQRSDLEVQIYGALTAEQQAKLPKVLADMKAQHAQHHANGQQKHGQTPAAT
jgi:Spy/CpxP family protein refolding chaperone